MNLAFIGMAALHLVYLLQDQHSVQDLQDRQQ